VSRINATITASHVDDFGHVLGSVAIHVLSDVGVIYCRGTGGRTRQKVAAGTSGQVLAFFGTDDGDGRALIGPVSVVQIGLAVANVRAQEAEARTIFVVFFELEQHAATEGRGPGLPMILHVLDDRFMCFLKTPFVSTNKVRIDIINYN